MKLSDVIFVLIFLIGSISGIYVHFSIKQAERKPEPILERIQQASGIMQFRNVSILEADGTQIEAEEITGKIGENMKMKNAKIRRGH